MKPIFLIGFSGVGKTTIARRLAQDLQMDFVDTDDFLTRRYHSTITHMFATCGIEKFRKRERAAIIELAHLQDTVIATGGGLPTHDDNLDLMLDSGVVIYLSASVPTIAQRLYLVRESRPLVADKTKQEVEQYVQETLPQHEKYYSRAHLTINADRMTTPQDEKVIVCAILLALREHDLTSALL